MVFSSLTFLCVFLPIVFLLYLAIPGTKVKNVFLAIASLIFYAYGEPVFILILLASTIINYLLGRVLVSPGGSKRRWLLALAVATNIGMLGVFKYSPVFIGSLNSILPIALPVPDFSFPLGISFYTFQALSYVIDVYRGTEEAQRNYLKVLLYIAFFPRLIAGPIEKYHEIEPQLSKRTVSLPEIAKGFRRFIVGLGKKVLIADVIALAVDAIFSAQSTQVNFLAAWIAAIGYLFQIYYDFSGYSDMAIGLGHMFGFTFEENFNYPYGSRSIKEFWRKWHISLSSWFREYLYYPLGGNRKGKLRTAINKMIVFFCTGLWHGGNWTFVLWGLWQGVFVVGEDYVPVKRLPKVLGHIYALAVVMVGFVMFRSESVTQGFTMIQKLYGGWDTSSSAMGLALQQLNPLFLFTMAIAIIGAFPIRRILVRWVRARKAEGVARFASYAFCLLLVILCIMSLSSGSFAPFIYARF